MFAKRGRPEQAIVGKGKKSVFGESEDSDEEVMPAKRPNLADLELPISKDTDETADEDEDELDAFMAGISEEVAQQLPSTKKPGKEQMRGDLDGEDLHESYISHMKAKGIEIGQTKIKTTIAEDFDSDEEVYATARAIDAASEANGIMEGDTLLNKDIQPLPPVDHSEIDYIEIGKDFYQQHQDISALSATEVAALRDLLKIQVIGRDVPAPCASFGHFGFDDILMRSIRANGFTEPTGIQKQAIPIALSGRDIIGIAKTGSGKTAAFLWPMLVHIMDQPELVKGDGPIALVLAPTRELAQQICSQAKKYGKSYNLKVNLVCGGASKGEQYKSLRKGGNEIVVGTPGRIIDLVKMKALDLRRVSYLVLDEADRMFDLGFEPQVRSICDNIRPDRQTLLFSATFKRVIERLARDILSEPVKIVVGDVGGANSDVTQVFQILPDHSHKWGWLIRNLVRFEVDGSVIIFVGRKLGVDELTSNLRSSGFQCAALHGDMTQDERDTTLRDFRSNKLKIMATSDVAARGLDIKGVRTVINYDVARDIDLHVHRIGRTGRAGEKGTAYTLITEAEDAFAATLVQNLQDSNLHVPEELLALAQRNGNFRRGHGAKSRGRGATRGQGRGARGRGGITQRNESHIGNMQSSANSFSNSIRFTPASSQQGRSTSAISRDTGNV